jgi:tRNA (guanine-N7-)-methyltransferase
LPLEQLQPYLLDVPAEPVPLDWSVAFGNERAVEMEVGFGKGLFLVSAAQANPQLNYLGIEIERKYQLFTANRLAKRGLSNVRLACADARTFGRDRVPAGSLRATHVYFPDPWWKKRHHKRRLFTAGFAEQLARVLRPGGMLHLASDVEEYFKIITDLVGRLPTLKPAPDDEGSATDQRGNFERKYRQEGRAIFEALYRKP